MTRFHLGNKGFTLVELLIGMTVFSVGITAIFLLLTETLKASVYSRNEVVVANLLREEIELVRNIRDSNLQNFAPWDKAKINNGATTSLTGGTFIVENDFTATGVTFGKGIATSTDQIAKTPVFMSGVTIMDVDDFDSGTVLKNKFEATRLYFDDQKRYTHTPSAGAVSFTGTEFASYVILSPIGYMSGGTFTGVENDGSSQGYLIDARVIVRDKGQYREYDAKSAITDWVR